MVPQAAQSHTPTLHLEPHQKNCTFVENSLWDWLVVANSAPRLNFLNIFKYCIRGPLTPTYKHPFVHFRPCFRLCAVWRTSRSSGSEKRSSHDHASFNPNAWIEWRNGPVYPMACRAHSSLGHHGDTLILCPSSTTRGGEGGCLRHSGPESHRGLGSPSLKHHSISGRECVCLHSSPLHLNPLPIQPVHIGGWLMPANVRWHTVTHKGIK